MDNKLGDIISELRNKKNLTQKQLANKLGISDKAISRWETGKSFPDLDMLFRISKFFNISLENLLKARMIDDGTDDELMQDIIREFNDMNKKHSKRMKIILLIKNQNQLEIIALIFLVILSIVFTAVIIFTNTYNRFKVYQVYIESEDIKRVHGIYVETNIKDTLILNNLNIRNLEINDNDIVSVDLYYVENKKEYIIQNYSDLNNIVFTNFQSYIKINDLSKYMNNLYIRITIIDSDNKVTKYKGKLEFTLDFSNNKIFLKDENEDYDYEYNILSIDEIKKILLNNGFETMANNVLLKRNDNFSISYFTSTNKISYSYEDNNLKYQYELNLKRMILKVLIYDENNLEIENYEYDVKNKKMIKCTTGSCNNYEEAMKVLNKNVLNLLKK